MKQLKNYINNICFRPAGNIYSLINSGIIKVPNNSFQILDIGCENLAGYFALNFNGLVNNFVCVNQFSENQFIAKWPENLCVDNNFGSGILDSTEDTLYNRYKSFYNKAGGNYFIDSEEEFKMKFKLIPDTKAEDFIKLNTSGPEFNLIVLSNLLHFIKFKDVLNILEYSMKNLSADGYIYIQVITKSSQSKYSDFQLSDDQLKKVESKINCFCNNELFNGQFQLVGKVNMLSEL